ncbi:hypothetical protein [Brachyspira sp.]|uniref:hypothetical protein n=1 Tax=Brachyspira sp. TaxID=1977261 RepID=UPI003D7C7CAF
MRLKICIIIICLIIFGCKSKVSYDGILMHKNDLPFKGYGVDYGLERDILLKTSISDSKFPDGVRYYVICPKNKHYQNFKNNLGRKVTARGEETYQIAQGDISQHPSTPNPEEPPYYQGFDEYRLEEAKIVKVY